MLRESQLGMVLFIEDHCKVLSREEFIKLYEEIYSELKEFSIPK